MTELTRLNHTHEAIALWLIGNPGKSQGVCAKEMNLTESWLSRVIHSDMFQAFYTDLCKERNEVAVHSIGNKLSHVANLTLDRTVERLEGGMVTDRFLTDARANVLSSLGYDGKNHAHVEEHLHLHKHEHLTADDVVAARERARIDNSKDIEMEVEA